MPITLNGDSGITTPTYGGTDTSEYLVPVTSFKNRIINGAMQIDQRNAGASVTPTANGVYVSADRWQPLLSQASKYSLQQNAGAVTTPVGFTNYLGATSLSAYTVLTGDYFILAQNIEGFNTADLQWGTANAQTVTLSFWIRSSLTGTFGGAIQNSAENRSYPFTYTISSANTWEQKTVTIAGDTSGTWIGATNGVGIRVRFGLGVGATYSGTAGSWAGATYFSATGATSVVGTNGATFYITGIQLEKGSTATSFDYRPYGTELVLCQRYYHKVTSSTSVFFKFAAGSGTTATSILFPIYYPVTMRASPSFSSSAANTFQSASGVVSAFTAINTDTISTSSTCLNFTTASNSAHIGKGVICEANSTTSAFLEWSAEL